MGKKTVKLSAQIPRYLSSFEGKIDPRQGLRLGLYGAVPFFIASGLSLFASIKVPLPYDGIRPILALGGTLLFLAIGLLFYIPARSRLANRVSALIYGQIVTGRVLSHGRAFVPWKSWQNYTLCATFETTHGQRNVIVESPCEALHEDFPVDSDIAALYEERCNKFFCPAEMGIEISVD